MIQMTTPSTTESPPATGLAAANATWPTHDFTVEFSKPEVAIRIMWLLVNNQRWVHRRVEAVSFRDHRTVARRVSVDFTVPQQAPRIQLPGWQPMRLIPLTLLRKRTLINFDLRDEHGSALPQLSMRANELLVSTMLTTWAAHVLDVESAADADPADDGATLGADTDGLTRDLRRIAGGTQQALLDTLDKWGLRDGDSALPDARRQDLLRNPYFKTLLVQMADNFPLLILVEDAPPRRRVVKFAYDEPFDLDRWRHHSREPHSDQHSRVLGWLKALAWRLGWIPMTVDFPTPSAVDAHSYHFEATAPDGVNITEAVLLAGRPDPQGSLTLDHVRGGYRRVNLHAVEVATGSKAKVRLALQVRRRGWLETACLASWITALVLGVGAWRLDKVTGKGPEQHVDIAATLLVTLMAMLATLLPLPAEHPVATKLISGARRVTAMSGLLPLIAAGSLIFGPSGAALQRTWQASAAIAVTLATIVSVTVLRAKVPKPGYCPWEQGRAMPRPPKDWPTTYEQACRRFHMKEDAVEIPSSEGERFPTKKGERLPSNPWTACEQDKVSHQLAALVGWSRSAQPDQLAGS